MTSCLEDKTESVDYLFPEILTREQILAILKERCIGKQDLSRMSKDELLQLYHQYVLPLPQRDYRNNRRGKKMMAMRSKYESSKTDSDSHNNLKPNSNSSSSNDCLYSHHTTNSSMSNSNACHSDSSVSLANKNTKNHFTTPSSMATVTSSRKITLKRHLDNSTNPDPKSVEEVNSTASLNETSPKKKHDRITWP